MTTYQTCTICEGGQEFGVRILRCHLSESFMDGPCTWEIDTELWDQANKPKSVNVSPPLLHRCEVLTTAGHGKWGVWCPGEPYDERAEISEGYSVLAGHGYHRAPTIEVPWRWLTGVFRFVGGGHSGEGRDIERVPLPGLISSERTPLPMNVSESLQ